MRRYKNKNCPIDLDIPILQEYVKKRDIVALYIDKWSENSPVTIEIWIDLMKMKKADVVEVVRCRDCKHFQPCFVLNADGERRPYTEEEIRKGKMVTGDVGINCGSRCERFGYWDENKIPVWFSENDFCSYGRRAEE